MRAHADASTLRLNFTEESDHPEHADRELMSAGDEERVLKNVELRSRRLNASHPGMEMPDAQAYGRVGQLFGGGRGAIPRGTTPEQVRADVHALAVPIAPPGERRKLFRGGVIRPSEIAAIMENFHNGTPHPDNYATAYALLHGYMNADDTRTTDRPPSTTTREHIATRYALSRTAKPGNPEGSKALHITIVTKSSARGDDYHAAKGVTSRYQLAGRSGKREILLDDRNTYRIKAFRVLEDRVHVTIVAEGESDMSTLSRVRANRPTDPASLTPEAAVARARHTRAAAHPTGHPSPPFQQPVHAQPAQQPYVTILPTRNRDGSISVEAYHVTPGVGTRRAQVVSYLPPRPQPQSQPQPQPQSQPRRNRRDGYFGRLVRNILGDRAK